MRGDMSKRQLPKAILPFIAKAKAIGGDWSKSESGRIALAFLLGYFDGDGWVNNKNFRDAVLYSSSEGGLQQIKDLYGVKNKVGTRPPRDIPAHDMEDIEIKEQEQKTKPSHWLTLGFDFYEQMIKAYNGGLDRKRPPKFRKNSNFIGDEI